MTGVLDQMERELFMPKSFPVFLSRCNASIPFYITSVKHTLFLVYAHPLIFLAILTVCNSDLASQSNCMSHVFSDHQVLIVEAYHIKHAGNVNDSFTHASLTRFTCCTRCSKQS